MENTGKVDFRASGVALDSSALIYLMKAKLLLSLEEPPMPPKLSQEFLPPPLFLPLRHELTSTTIKHLLEVLDEILEGEKRVRLKKKIAPPYLPSLSEVLPPTDFYLREIEEQMEKLYATLLLRAGQEEVIAFSTLMKGELRLEIIQKFILLLFLAQEGRVNLWQKEETGEIYVITGDKYIAS